jgi:aspartate racemase
MKIVNKIPIVGIIGGMGPFASLHFHHLLMHKFTGISKPPEIIMDSISIDDFTQDNSKIAPALKIISNRISLINQLNPKIIVMTCNTAHILHPHLTKITTANFPNLIELVAKKISESKSKKVLLLSSPNTIKNNLYSSLLNSQKTSLVIPTNPEIKEVESVIKNLITGIIRQKDVDILNQIISSHPQIDGLILGCTELSLIAPKLKAPQIFDSLEILADHVFAETI